MDLITTENFLSPRT